MVLEKAGVNKGFFSNGTVAQWKFGDKLRKIPHEPWIFTQIVLEVSTRE